MSRKLTDEQVIMARQMYREGQNFTAIGKHFGFTSTPITKAVFGITHSSVPGSLPLIKNRGNRKLTDAQVLEAREMYRRGHLLTEVSACLGMSNDRTASVLKGASYSHVPGQVSENEWHPRRGQRGSFSHTAKIDDMDAIEIRQRLAKGESQTSLAKEFGVSRPAISLIASGKSWAHLGGSIASPIDNRARHGSSNGSAKLDEEKVRYIKWHLNVGVAISLVAMYFKVDSQIVRRIFKKKTWKSVRPKKPKNPVDWVAVQLRGMTSNEKMDAQRSIRLRGKRLEAAFQERKSILKARAE